MPRSAPTTDSASSPRTILSCRSCGARNRIGAIARGTPACARCHEPLAWLVEADDATFDAETSASVPILVDLWAQWCGPCRAVAPLLERLAVRHAGRLKVVKVDVDGSPAISARFAVQAIPLLVVLRDGREVDRIVGAPSPASLEARIASVLDGR